METITKSYLRENIEELFSNEAGVALFYFADHETIINLGGYLVTQDKKRYDDGVAIHDLLAHPNMI